MEKQPAPSDAACPSCGGEPIEEEQQHQLQALGYTHDDIHMKCEDCGKEWTCGVPIGDPDSADLRCDSCEESRGDEIYGRVNWMRLNEDAGAYEITVKCPRCFYVWGVRREATNGAAMMGDPVVAGNMDDVENPFEDME